MKRSQLPGIVILVCASQASADLSAEIAQAWQVAEQRCGLTVAAMESIHGDPGMYSSFPTVENLATGQWSFISHNHNWQDGFWPGTLWILAQHAGSAIWKQRAVDWSAALATSTLTDHDIGFVTLSSLGKGRLFEDDLTDPSGTYRTFAKDAISAAAATLDARFNQAVVEDTPVPAGFTRSWDHPFQNPYPVCIDNLMNLEVMFLGYELNGRSPADRDWFEHALTHARNSIARLMRPDGSTYHVVQHFEYGPDIGRIYRKITVQGYGNETTWSRGQAWAIYGLTATFRHARRDPGTDASDVLVAAKAAADYFIDHLPHNLTTDVYNHRPGDFVPPCDFDAALGEPAGPWNDANNNYNPEAGTGLGDRRPALNGFTLRDSSAAAIAASGMIELSGYVHSQADRDHYLGAAEDILHCLITYDGPDQDSDPDYLCRATETDHPGILKSGCIRWGDANKSLVYGDYYFLEALARYEALTSRKVLENTRRISGDGPNHEFEFERATEGPTLAFRVLYSGDLSSGNWQTVAEKTGAGPWSGTATTTEELLPSGRTLVKIHNPAPGTDGFFRVLTRSIGGGS